MLFATLTLILTALAPFTAAQVKKGDKISAKDHHNYGNQKGTWYAWDKNHTFRPVPCKTTADCVKVAKSGVNRYKKCPFPLTKDKRLFDVDLNLKWGGTICEVPHKEKVHECTCGVDFDGSAAHVKNYCTEFVKTLGLDIKVLSGCFFGKPGTKSYTFQCMAQCGPKNKKCQKEAKTKGPYKLVDKAPVCKKK
ncbi:unnamed protein product [Zymoseptoria tritici ST99CH_3D1]|uniref:Secreted protein n=1 Tax=Zymoseptoria tritici (strain ST99CH_3D7) TaxID=1276538 RepID=A0A1X7RJG7_ZYMT9|nr:unnamed protein product [Zymoseptoria tritici ST99CH_3D7]SMR47124.1 unnamed protein product [Zymoseptoria tritici ST99CH_3D1]